MQVIRKFTPPRSLIKSQSGLAMILALIVSSALIGLGAASVHYYMKTVDTAKIEQENLIIDAFRMDVEVRLRATGLCNTNFVGASPGDPFDEIFDGGGNPIYQTTAVNPSATYGSNNDIYITSMALGTFTPSRDQPLQGFINFDLGLVKGDRKIPKSLRLVAQLNAANEIQFCQVENPYDGPWEKREGSDDIFYLYGSAGFQPGYGLKSRAQHKTKSSLVDPHMQLSLLTRQGNVVFGSNQDYMMEFRVADASEIRVKPQNATDPKGYMVFSAKQTTVSGSGFSGAAPYTYLAPGKSMVIGGPSLYEPMNAPIDIYSHADYPQISFKDDGSTHTWNFHVKGGTTDPNAGDLLIRRDDDAGVVQFRGTKFCLNADETVADACGPTTDWDFWSTDQAGGTDPWDSTSDERLKSNVKPIFDARERVHQLRGVSFTWKRDPKSQTQYGFIAQEVQQVVPEIVRDGDVLTMRQNQLTPVLVEAYKDLNSEVDSSIQTLEALKQQLKGTER